MLIFHYSQGSERAGQSKIPTLKPVWTLDNSLVVLEASRMEAELSRRYLPVVLAGLLLGHAFHWIARPEHFVVVASEVDFVDNFLVAKMCDY